MHFRRFFFTYALVFFITLFLAVAFFRFIYLKDFKISYESECDPSISSCFIGCTNEECTETYPYKYILKHATDITKRCDLNDIENCEAAHICLREDKICEISFCNVLEEECYIATERFNI